MPARDESAADAVNAAIASKPTNESRESKDDFMRGTLTSPVGHGKSASVAELNSEGRQNITGRDVVLNVPFIFFEAGKRGITEPAAISLAPCRPRNTQAPTAPKKSGTLGTTSLPAPNLNRRSIEQIGEGTMLAFKFHDQAVVVSNTADRMDDEINGQPDQP